jgi:hypothetical protein
MYIAGKTAYTVSDVIPGDDQDNDFYAGYSPFGHSPVRRTSFGLGC